MRTAGVLVLCSLAFCAGTWLVVGGWRQPRPTLQRAMSHLHRPGVVVPASTADAPDLVERVGAFVEQRGASTWTRAWTQPLRLVGRALRRVSREVLLEPGREGPGSRVVGVHVGASIARPGRRPQVLARLRVGLSISGLRSGRLSTEPP